MSPTQQPTAAPNIEALPAPSQPTDEERNQKYLEQFRKEIPENRVAIQHQFQEAVAVQAGARQNIAALIMDQTAIIADPKAGDSQKNAARNRISAMEKSLKMHTENLSNLCAAYADFAMAESALE